MWQGRLVHCIACLRGKNVVTFPLLSVITASNVSKIRNVSIIVPPPQKKNQVVSVRMPHICLGEVTGIAFL